MQAKLINEGPERTYVLIFETGDEVMAGLQRFADEHALAASRFAAIGAFSDAVLGYFDWEKKDYERIPVNEQVEVLSLIGDIAQEDGRPKLHIHAVLGRRDGSVCGGHLLEARVRPTLEVVLDHQLIGKERTGDTVALLVHRGATAEYVAFRVPPRGALMPQKFGSG